MDKKRIILVTGGQRSGKSAFSEKLALDSGLTPTYLATAEVRDDEFRERVKIHRARRGPEWVNLEEPFSLSRYNLSDHAVVIDCVTMWLTNVFFQMDEDVTKTLEFMKAEFNDFTANPATYIFVSNEIGMGGIGATPLQRKFTDAQGWINQHIAAAADEVYLLVAGIPLKIK